MENSTQIRLTPTERLIIFTLRCKPGQIFEEIAETTGTRSKSRLREALRMLLAAGLIHAPLDEEPAGYYTTAEGAQRTVAVADLRAWVNGDPLPLRNRIIDRGIHRPNYYNDANDFFDSPEESSQKKDQIDE
jgi:DNA-binding HxlR family transcriptional regulator